jgi:hypothetical protein
VTLVQKQNGYLRDVVAEQDRGCESARLEQAGRTTKPHSQGLTNVKVLIFERYVSLDGQSEEAVGEVAEIVRWYSVGGLGCATIDLPKRQDSNTHYITIGKMPSGLSCMSCSSFDAREMLECRSKAAQSPAYHDIICSGSATGPQPRLTRSRRRPALRAYTAELTWCARP